MYTEKLRKITHHPEVEKLIALYRETGKKADSFKVSPTTSSDYQFKIELMEKDEIKHEWSSIGEMFCNLELINELTYPPHEFWVSVDNNPDYTWYTFGKGGDYFIDDVYTCSTDVFKDMMINLNDAENCDTILHLRDWKKLVAIYLLDLPMDHPVIKKERDAAPDEYMEDRILRSDLNEIFALFFNCMNEDTHLKDTVKYFYAEDTAIVQVFVSMIISLRDKLQLSSPDYMAILVAFKRALQQ